MCASLGVTPSDKLKTMSKGTKEKVQLVLVMARKAQLYLLDEPIAGVDPAVKVVLPLPLGPRSPTIRPRPSSRFTPLIWIGRLQRTGPYGSSLRNSLRYVF